MEVSTTLTDRRTPGLLNSLQHNDGSVIWRRLYAVQSRDELEELQSLFGRLGANSKATPVGG